MPGFFPPPKFELNKFPDKITKSNKVEIGAAAALQITKSIAAAREFDAVSARC